MTSNDINGTYQWFDCNNNTIIEGETNQSYEAILSGSYAVIVGNGIDKDTSDCIDIIVTDITSNNSI